MSDRSIDEISRLLFVSFSEFDEVEISDLIRLWSLELQWMEPNDSQMVINKLLDSGWLVCDNRILTPARGIKKTLPELGWRPIFRIISNPPNYTTAVDNGLPIQQPKVSKAVVEVIQSQYQLRWPQIVLLTVRKEVYHS